MCLRLRGPTLLVVQVTADWSADDWADKLARLTEVGEQLVASGADAAEAKVCIMRTLFLLIDTLSLSHPPPSLSRARVRSLSYTLARTLSRTVGGPVQCDQRRRRTWVPQAGCYWCHRDSKRYIPFL